MGSTFVNKICRMNEFIYIKRFRTLYAYIYIYFESIDEDCLVALYSFLGTSRTKQKWYSFYDFIKIQVCMWVFVLVITCRITWFLINLNSITFFSNLTDRKLIAKCLKHIKCIVRCYQTLVYIHRLLRHLMIAKYSKKLMTFCMHRFPFLLTRVRPKN